MKTKKVIGYDPKKRINLAGFIRSISPSMKRFRNKAKKDT